MSTLDTPEPLPKIEEKPPQTELPDTVFNFKNGELGKVKRIVQRQQLKTRIKFLQQVIRTHQPLVQAMKVTQKAYQEGVQFGFQKAVTEIQQAEKEAKAQEANSTKQEPGQEVPVSTETQSKKYEGLPSASPELTTLLNP